MSIKVSVIDSARLKARISQAHHIGNPPTSFRNPWPSFGGTKAFIDILSTRFGRDRNFVPVPQDRDGLVKVRKPNWGYEEDKSNEHLKATWIGHATFLVEMPITKNHSGEYSDAQINDTAASKAIPLRKGVTVLFDPVFAQRTSPSKLFGPKRYTPTPCTISELPQIDLVVISHNHYDHLDIDAIRDLRARNHNTHFICPLGNARWFQGAGVGIPAENVTELDWWHGLRAYVPEIGSVQLTCTPAQHNSNRSFSDRDTALWGSWVLEQVIDDPPTNSAGLAVDFQVGKKLYFAGDTGYRTVQSNHPTVEEEATAPHCPAFAEVGETFGPIDLALLPIGLYLPRIFMSSVHCAPEDSVCIHKDIQSKKSIGMHYGTVRGGLSGQYEDVREPPKRFQEQSEKAGLKWGTDTCVCDVGETVLA